MISSSPTCFFPYAHESLGANIFGTDVLQQGFQLFDLFRSFGFNAEQDAATTNTGVINFGAVFRDARAD